MPSPVPASFPDPLWQASFDAMPDLIAILDKDRRILRMNRAMAEKLGGAAGGAVGLPCYECVHGTQEAPAFCPHTRMLADGCAHTVEEYDPKLGGEYRITASPIRNADGSIFGSVHVARDITVALRNERAIGAIVRSVIGGESGAFERIARAVVDWLGADSVMLSETLAEGKARTLAWILDGEAKPESAFSLAGTPCAVAVETGFCHYPADVAALFPESAAARLGMAAYLGIEIRDGGGGVRGVLCAMARRRLDPSVMLRSGLQILAALAGAELDRRDREAERVRTEERLRQSEKMEAVGRLAGGIAHDFNNHLASVRGYGELLRARVGDPKLQRYAEHIVTAAKNSADLIRQLLTFSRKGRQTTAVDLHRIARSVVAILQHSLDKRIEIRLQLRAPAPIVQGDPAQIENAILNLAINAGDAMPGGGVLMIETEAATLPAAALSVHGAPRPGDYLAITVRDTGPGIPPELQARIFEPFFTTKEEGRGTGLGLATVLAAAEGHGGGVGLDSGPGRGSAFVLFLPAAPPSAGAVEEEAVVRGSGRIWVIDDEPAVAEMAGEALALLGYDAKIHTDPVRAVEEFSAAPAAADLVMLDMIMPRLGGLEVFRKLREIRADLPILIVSGFSRQGETAQALHEGAAGFLMKPFDLAPLSQAIRKAMTGGEKGAGCQP